MKEQELVIRMLIVDYVNTNILGNEKDEIDEGKNVHLQIREE